jgi:hypothetical protein
MIDPAQILSQRMVDRYCAGQLSPEETAEFEAYLLDHPELLDDIEVTRRLKLGLGSLRAKGELPGLVGGKAGMSRNRMVAIAASVIVGAGIAWYFSRTAAVAPPILAATVDGFRGELHAPDAIAEVMLIRSRSGDRVELEIPPVPRLYKVRIVADTRNADSRFDIELRRESASGGSPVLVQRAVDVRPESDGMLSVYLDPRAAGAGSYLLRVLGHGSAQGSTGEYELTLK